MYILPKVITLDVLRDYASYLFGRVSESEHLKFKVVNLNGNHPLPNNCHENARKFVQSNPSYGVVYGWICVDDGLASPSVDFIAHSVIQDVNGNLFEITPIYCTTSRPFLTAKLNNFDFADIVNELESLSGEATLVHYK
jgi:hypothetical protein